MLKKIIFCLIYTFVIVSSTFAQNEKKQDILIDPLYQIAINVYVDNQLKKVLKLGIDPLASDGLDRNLGESELPPLPPSGIFDIRFIFPDGIISSWTDIREGYSNMTNIEILYNIEWKLQTNQQELKFVFSVPEVEGSVTLQITDVFNAGIIDFVIGEGENQLIILDGNELSLEELNINVIYNGSIITSLEEIINNPEEYILYQNYPNPFNPNTTISYALPVTSKVSLKVFNILGEKVNELVNEVQETGNYTVPFNASNVPSGVYFYSLQAGDFNIVKKMVVNK